MLQQPEVSQIREQVSSADHRGGVADAARDNLRQEGQGLLKRPVDVPVIVRFPDETRQIGNVNSENGKDPRNEYRPRM